MEESPVVKDQPNFSGQNESPPWVYVPEACQILGKSAVTLQRWRTNQYGPPAHLNGNRCVYKRSDLYDWMLGRTD